MRSREIYFNPNWQPTKFYRRIKAACLLYDRVLVWCPGESHLEGAGLRAGDFLDLCRGTEVDLPAIYPVFRETWIDFDNGRINRRILGDKVFHNNVVKLSQAGHLERKLILPTAIYEDGYNLSDLAYQRALRQNGDATEFDLRLSKIAGEFDDSFLEKAHEVAHIQNKSNDWGVVNVFSQDIIAIGQLGAPSPLATRASLGGYKLFSESGVAKPLEIPFEVSTEDMIGDAKWLSGFDLDSMSVSDIFAWRRNVLPHLRELAMNHGNTPELSFSSDEFEERLEKLAQALLKRSDDAALGTVGFSTTAIVSAVVANAGLAGSFLQALPVGAPVGATVVGLLLFWSLRRAKLARFVAGITTFNALNREIVLNSVFAADALLSITGSSGLGGDAAHANKPSKK